MTRKRCRRCKHFLPQDYHKLYCLSCKRKINKAKREEKPKIIKVYKHKFKKPIVKKVVEPEIYRGKKEKCPLCEDMANLYASKKFPKKICEDCEKWVPAKTLG